MRKRGIEIVGHLEFPGAEVEWAGHFSQPATMLEDFAPRFRSKPSQADDALFFDGHGAVLQVVE